MMMVYIITGFIFGLLIPYMSRRFAKFMPATPAYALYRLIKPNKVAKKAKLSEKYKKRRNAYIKRSLIYAFISAIVSGLIVYSFSGHNVWWYMGFVWILLLLTEIDYKMFLLPDILTVPLLITGFVFASFTDGTLSPQESAFAALAGYVLPVVATLLMLWRSVDAFGGGDIKLFSGVGAWLGFEGLIFTILLSCLVFGVYSAIRRQRSGAFGPAIAVSAIAVLLCFYGMRGL
jgi:prepilin signal peptidase PulO-like enzyme (type II secretory pathway)